MYLLASVCAFIGLFETPPQEEYREKPEYAHVFEQAASFLDSISIQQINHHSHGDPSLFYTLPLSSQEEKVIESIILTLAETNIFGLLFEKSDLEKKGKFIEHVHPLRFLGVVFSRYELRMAMSEIKKSTFKWDGFMEGLERRIREEQIRDNLMRYVSGFSRHVHADPDKISAFIQHHNWEGLIRYLM